MSHWSKPTTAAHAKSALSRVVRATSLIFKTSVSADFSDMSKYVVLSGTPVVSSGRLSGKVALRYVDEMSSDNYKVTATVGAVSAGRTWLMTCANADFSRFYALELNGNAAWSIIHGTGTAATASTGLLGIVTGIIGFVLGIFEDIIAALFGQSQVNQSAPVGSDVTVWWDEETSTIRAYLNGVQKTSLVVSRHELQHIDGFRYFGIVTGIDGPTAGVKFNHIEAQDV